MEALLTPTTAGKVQIIDDDLGICALVQEVLSAEGFDVQSTNTGESGLLTARTWLPDILLCDLNLPDLHGTEIIRRIKAERADLEVIVVTSHATVATAIEALRSGASDYLYKPFDQIELLVKAVKRAHQHQQLLLNNAHLIGLLK